MAKIIRTLRDIAQGYYYAVKDTLLKDGLPAWRFNQVVKRMELCEDCVKLGKCPHCHCLSPALFFAPEKSCALGKWGPLLSEEEYKKSIETNDNISESPTRLGDKGDTRTI